MLNCNKSVLNSSQQIPADNRVGNITDQLPYQGDREPAVVPVVSGIFSYLPVHVAGLMAPSSKIADVFSSGTGAQSGINKFTFIRATHAPIFTNYPPILPKTPCLSQTKFVGTHTSGR